MLIADWDGEDYTIPNDSLFFTRELIGNAHIP